MRFIRKASLESLLETGYCTLYSSPSHDKRQIMVSSSHIFGPTYANSANSLFCLLFSLSKPSGINVFVESQRNCFREGISFWPENGLMETAAFELGFWGMWGNIKCETNQKRLDGLVWWGKAVLKGLLWIDSEVKDIRLFMEVEFSWNEAVWVFASLMDTPSQEEGETGGHG